VNLMKFPAVLSHLPIVLLASAPFLPSPLTSQEIPSPEEFFGFQMGADRQLARWDRLVTYYDSLSVLSDRLEVIHMGPSTLGNPFLAIFASSPENIANLDEIRRMNAVLQDPRGHSQAEIDSAIELGKVVFVQSYGLHSTEVAASQTAAEVMYELATRTDSEVTNILENTVSIMIPSFNPDGAIMVTDWYDQWLGTEFEGTGVPSLYHHYIGHDNNRDAFMQNTVESQYGAQIIFREWVPQAYIDHHQMGAYTARISLPPYAEPIRPEADPLVWREMSWYGAHMAYKMDEAELSGAIGSAIYSGWGHFGFHWITPFHNIAGIDVPEPVARRVVARSRYRGATEGRDVLTAPDRCPEPRDCASKRLQQVESADPARNGGRRRGVHHPDGTARSPDDAQACQQAPGSGNQRGAGVPGLHARRAHVRTGYVHRLHGPAEARRHSVVARAHVLSG
jgi:hypothetical protein